MADSSYFRSKAEQAIRLARSDPVLQKSLTDAALDYFARAIATEALQSGKDQQAK
jgi:hypothetical protein